MPEEPEAGSSVQRVVLEPNVLVSAAITNGTARRLLEAGASGWFTIVACPSLLDELAGVLSRPRFERWRSRGELNDFVAGIARVAEAVSDPDPLSPVLRDPTDDYLIALARSAHWSRRCRFS